MSAPKCPHCKVEMRFIGTRRLEKLDPRASYVKSWNARHGHPHLAAVMGAAILIRKAANFLMDASDYECFCGRRETKYGSRIVL